MEHHHPPDIKINKAEEAVKWRKISVTHPQTMAYHLYCCGWSLRHEHVHHDYCQVRPLSETNMQ